MSVAVTSASSAAGEFLAGLYAPFTEGWLTLFTLDRRSGTRAVEWATVDQPDALALTAEFHVDHCIWFGVATRTHRLGEGRRGTAKECAALPGLWVDLDVAGPNHGTANLPATVEEALELQERFPLPATAIIATGGGLQAHWAFSEPLPVDDEAVTLLGRWGATWAKHAADAGRHIDNVFNVDRIMRLPGTWNTKSDPAQHVEVLGADWSLRYGVDDLDQWMVEPPPVTIATPRERAVPYIGPERPGDAFNARHSCAEILAAAGFEAHRALRNGDQHFRWPGATNDIGATVYADDGHATVWSETFVSTHPGVALRRPYDPFGLHAALEHAGDAAAAASALRLEGYGAPPRAEIDLHDMIGRPAPVKTVKALDDTPALHLPATFWSSRPAFDHIHQAARSRLVAPDAVLAAVLTRVAASTPHTVELPGIVGSAVALSYFAAIVGPPEAGKSAAAAVAAELLPAPSKVLDRLPIGTGEGMVEILFDFVEETDDKGKTTRVKQQVHHGAIFHIDEGAVLADIGSRSGATLLPTLRTAFSHGTLGNTNASVERRRILDGRLYVYGVTLGIQPSLAGPLLGDTAAGTPQRFLWLMATDPEAGVDRPEWPDVLEWSPPNVGQLESVVTIRGGWRRHQLRVHDEIADELVAARVAAIRGDQPREAGDAHRGLVRLKTAALLALLDDRLEVDVDDWRLAGTIVDTSRAVRRAVEATLLAEDSQREASATARVVRREVAVEESRADRALASAARSVAAVIARHHARGEHAEQGGGCTRRCLTQAIASKHREVVTVDSVVSKALAERTVEDREGRFWPASGGPS